MGRVVLFSKQDEVECPAIVTGWQNDNTHRGGTLVLTALRRDRTEAGEFAPGLEGHEDAGGRKWRWPPRA